jgi:hypothetical protein
MARRTRSTDKNTPEVQEDTVSTTTTEAPEATTTEAESPEAVEAAVQATDAEVKDAPKATDAEVDLTAFNEAVEKALAEKDSATGEIAPAFIDPVNKAYRELDGLKAKNKAKASLNEAMKEAMNKMDIAQARAYLVLSENLTAGGGSKAEKAPADPTEAFVQRYAGLRLALELVGSSVPEGVDEGWADKAKALYDSSVEQAKAYSAWVSSDAEDKGEEPEATAVVKAAVKLSQGKAAKVGAARTGGSTFSGERRDIAKHIQQAFESKEEGDFLSVAEIKNFHSDEYGDSSPSAGAISARLFPTSGKCTVEGVTPSTNDKGHKGAVKSAA